MKHLLTILVVLAGFSLNAQNSVVTKEVEILKIERYTVLNGVFAFVKSGRIPTHTLSIELTGVPYDEGSTVTSAVINFYDSNDPNSKQKPTYNEKEKKITASYPSDAFPAILEMINAKKKKKTSLTFNYTLNPTKHGVRAFFNLTGTM